MKFVIIFLSALTISIGFSCKKDSENMPPTGVLLNDTFATNTNGWEGEYTDYGTPQDSLIKFKFEYVDLPKPLNESQKALRLYGENRSDDLFIFVRKKLANLSPNSTYNLLFEVELATPHPASSFGVGGSPATSVFLKAGASAIKPEKIKEGNFYKFSLDKGNQAQSGKDMVVIGNMANGKEIVEYTLVQRSNVGKPFTVKTNANGELWLIIGTDSGFEGNQFIYYTRIKITAL